MAEEIKSNKSMKFDKIQIKLASPENILEWSHGEVTKPETINYRTLKPEKDGLFCERIFGPSKDWECHCGKYKKIKDKGIVCDKCGVEVTKASVRRDRMGHIHLAAPVSHIWYFKGIPSRMDLILDIGPKNLEKVLYFASYIVIDPGETDIPFKKILSETEYRELCEQYGSKAFRVGMGAEAILELLQMVNLEDHATDRRGILKHLGGADLVQAQSLHNFDVVGLAGDRRLHKRYLQFHTSLPPYQPSSSSTVLPRIFATSSALRREARPSMVAFTMLIGLLEP